MLKTGKLNEYSITMNKLGAVESTEPDGFIKQNNAEFLLDKQTFGVISFNRT